MLLEGIQEGSFRLIQLNLMDGTDKVVADFPHYEAIRRADEFNRRRRLPIHPVVWVYDHRKQRIRSEKDVGVPILGLD